MLAGSVSARRVEGALLRLADHHDVDGTRLARVWTLAGADGFSSSAAPSSICTDGTPFEIGVSLGAERGGLRYLAEIGKGRPAWRRLLDARQRLPRLLSVLDLPAEPFVRLVDAFLPRRFQEFPELIFGLWVCPVLRARSRELKVYLNTSWWEADELWAEIYHIAARTGRSDVGVRLDDVRRVLEPSQWSCFVCLETTRNGLGRIKLYFRGGRVTWDLVRALSREGGQVLPETLWRRLLGTRSLAAGDAVVCLSLAGPEHHPALKVDFAAKFLGPKEAAIRERIGKVAQAEALDLRDYRATIDAFRSQGMPLRHTVVGLSAREGRPRVSVYLRPVLRDTASLLRVMSAITSPGRAIANRTGSE